VELVLATRNAHKLREFEPLLAPHTVVPLPDEVELPPETGMTFEENALGKARAAAAATGRVAVADDSGIAAAALDGRPGVYSARYAGAARPTSRTSPSCSTRCRTRVIAAWRTSARSRT
jgi:XTP/dITP diphosphohydrolase